MSAALQRTAKTGPDVERRAWSAIRDLRAECRRTGQPLAEVAAALVMGVRPTVYVSVGDLPDDLVAEVSARVRSILERLPSVARVVAEWRAEREREERDARLPGPLMAAPRATQLESPDEAPRPTAENAPVSDRVIPFESRARAGEREREDLKHDGLTDVFLGERLARDLEGQFVCERASGDWYLWDGRRWALDDGGTRLERAAMGSLVAVAREIGAAAATNKDQGLALNMHKFARRCCSTPGQAAAIAKLRVLEGIAVDRSEFDSDPWRINTLDGTLDLRSGEILPHDPRDRMTLLAPVRFDPDARSPELERILDDQFGDDYDSRRFLARSLGSALVGVNRDKSFLVLLGARDTGKTTLVEACLRALGDYGRHADVESFLRSDFQNNARPRPDLVALIGGRLIGVSEADHGARFDAPLLKRWTGGDGLAFRDVYQKQSRKVSIRHAGRLVIACNDLPRLDSEDDALWSRACVVRFDRAIERPDPRIKDALLDVERSGAAVFAWLWRGFQEWQASGLGRPERVLEATAKERRDRNPLATWAEDECLLDPMFWTATADLYQSYSRHCEEGSRRPVSVDSLGRLLQGLGCTPRRTRAARGWQGIALRVAHDERGGDTW